MTKYEELINKSDECCIKAIEFAEKQDWNMSLFYQKASQAFMQRALKLSIKEII